MSNRSSIPLALALLAAASLVGCSSGPHAAERLTRDANRQYAGGDYAGALETYRRAEVLRPDLPALNYNAGNTLNRQSDFNRALTEDQQALHSTDPDVQDRAYYSMGNAFVRTNQLREALNSYKSVLRINPSDVDAKYNLEVIQRRLDQQEAQRQQAQGQDQQGAPSEQGVGSQQGQAAQGQGDGQPAQAADGGQAAPGQAAGGPGGEQSGTPGTGTASGYTGTPAGQAEALDPDLKKALEQFDRTGNIDDALRALDIVGQQERIRQAAGGAPPRPQGRDW